MAHAAVARQAELAQRPFGAAADRDRRPRPQPLDQLAQHLGARSQLAHRGRAVRERRSGAVRMRRDDVPEHRVGGDAERRQRAVHDRPRLLGPTLGPHARGLERLAPAHQRALGRERDAREAATGVAHRLAHQQQRRSPRARVQIGRGVGAPERRAFIALERGVGVAEHAEGRAERALGDRLDEVAEPARAAQAGAPAFSAARTCAAMRSRTAAASPARRSAMGSGWACTMSSKKRLRSW